MRDGAFGYSKAQRRNSGMRGERKAVIERKLHVVALVVAVLAASGCGGADLESTHNLERLNARPAADLAAARTPPDSCIRIHDIWRDQLRLALKMADRPRREREEAFLKAVYRPHRFFWEGYVGDERDVGVVVSVHDGGGYEVEFVSAAGETLAVLTLTEADIRPVTGAEILHVRDLASI
jgi:hypothetical protein